MIGPGADRPLTLDIPIFVADMSFGPLRLVAGQGAAGAGLPLQGRAGRQDRDGRGGLRTESDFIKALALGADAVAVGNSALPAIGCLGMRACHTNNCPVGIATQKPDLRARLIVEESAQRLTRFLEATVALMQVMARACGHSHTSQFEPSDLTTWDRDMAALSGVHYAGM